MMQIVNFHEQTNEAFSRFVRSFCQSGSQPSTSSKTILSQALVQPVLQDRLSAKQPSAMAWSKPSPASSSAQPWVPPVNPPVWWPKDSRGKPCTHVFRAMRKDLDDIVRKYHIAHDLDPTSDAMLREVLEAIDRGSRKGCRSPFVHCSTSIAAATLWHCLGKADRGEVQQIMCKLDIWAWYQSGDMPANAIYDLSTEKAFKATIGYNAARLGYAPYGEDPDQSWVRIYERTKAHKEVLIRWRGYIPVKYYEVVSFYDERYDTNNCESLGPLKNFIKASEYDVPALMKRMAEIKAGQPEEIANKHMVLKRAMLGKAKEQVDAPLACRNTFPAVMPKPAVAKPKRKCPDFETKTMAKPDEGSASKASKVESSIDAAPAGSQPSNAVAPADSLPMKPRPSRPCPTGETIDIRVIDTNMDTETAKVESPAGSQPAALSQAAAPAASQPSLGAQTKTTVIQPDDSCIEDGMKPTNPEGGKSKPDFLQPDADDGLSEAERAAAAEDSNAVEEQVENNVPESALPKEAEEKQQALSAQKQPKAKAKEEKQDVSTQTSPDAEDEQQLLSETQQQALLDVVNDAKEKKFAKWKETTAIQTVEMVELMHKAEKIYIDGLQDLNLTCSNGTFQTAA